MKYMKHIWVIVLLSSLATRGLSQAAYPENTNIPQPVTPGAAITSFPGLVNYSATLKRNFVRTFSPVVPVAAASQQNINVNAVQPNSSITETHYFDNLGRPLQEVYKRTAFGNQDLVKVHVYDAKGRETYEYQPYSPGTSDGKFKTNVLTGLPNCYNAQMPGEEPYSLREYDGSALDMVIKTMRPGKNWVGNARGMLASVETNDFSGLNAIPWFTIGYLNTDLPVLAANYPASTLFRFRTQDEDGNVKYEIKDVAGKLIAESIQTGTTLQAVNGGSGQIVPTFKYTYYVYDDFGHLRCVLPPLMNINNINAATVAELCYTYFYDKKGRVTEKKIPGKAVEYFVYDKMDRLVMKQDGNLRANNQWYCYVYDVYDRVLAEAIYTSASSRTTWESYFQNTTMPSLQPSILGYVTAYNLVRNPFTLSIQPSDATLITRNYYDDYNYSGLSLNVYDAGLNASVPTPATAETLPNAATANTRGLQTSAALRIQNPDGTWPNLWNYTINYYNNKAQLIQTLSAGPGYTETQSNRYYFTGEVAATALKHYQQGVSTIVARSYDKDVYGHNVTLVQQSINGAAFVPLSNKTYDFMGRVVNKRLGTDFNNYYTYNIQGWLTGINPDYVTNGWYDPNTGPFFGETIAYDKGFASKLYNGNIAGIQWRKSTGAPKEFYGYTYDNANRLKHAEYSKWESPGGSASATWTKNHTDYTVSGIAYDDNGNLQSMNQRGPVYTSASNGNIIPGDMDQLVYQYLPNSNKLKAVTDNATGVPVSGNPDFRNDAGNSSQDYDFDANGNLKKDLNKGISAAITYSIHNKPLTIAFDNGSTIKYTYDALGNKLGKLVTPAGGAAEEWNYAGGSFVYKNNELQYILHDEGRVRPATPAITSASTDYVYDFFFTDHLNNVRAVVGTNLVWSSIFSPTTNPGNVTPAFRLYRATMEVAYAGTESAVWEKLNEVRDVNPYPTASDDAKAARLNADEADRQVGTALMLKTMPGDKIDIAGYNYYDSKEYGDNMEGNGGLADVLLTTLSGGINPEGVPISELDENMAILKSTIGNTAFGPTLDALDAAEYNPEQPASNLVWIFFDEGMHPMPEKSGSLQASGADEWALAQAPLLEIDKPGYILIFTKSLARRSVWWNNLEIKVYQGAIQEENHYYPFGLTLSQSSANAGERNNIKFQSQHYETDLGLNLYNFKYRNHDPQIGRFWQIDPLADKYVYNSTYAFSENKVVNGIELEGLEWQPINSQGEDISLNDKENINGYRWTGTTLVGYKLGGITYSPNSSVGIALGAAGALGVYQGSAGTTDKAYTFSTTGMTTLGVDNNGKATRTYQRYEDISTGDERTDDKLATLHPDFRNQATEFVLMARLRFDIPLRITDGFRTYEQQDALYAQGRTTPGARVTNARGGYSNHNFGLAIDVVQLSNNQLDYEGTNYSQLGRIGTRLGLEWGGNWRTIVDRPHFQNLQGRTLGDLRQMPQDENGYVIFNH